jgi:hypothetical protein
MSTLGVHLGRNGVRLDFHSCPFWLLADTEQRPVGICLWVPTDRQRTRECAPNSGSTRPRCQWLRIGNWMLRAYSEVDATSRCRFASGPITAVPKNETLARGRTLRLESPTKDCSSSPLCKASQSRFPMPVLHIGQSTDGA